MVELIIQPKRETGMIDRKKFERLWGYVFGRKIVASGRIVDNVSPQLKTYLLDNSGDGGQCVADLVKRIED